MKTKQLSSAGKGLIAPRRFKVGERVEGFASKPTGACGTVVRVLKRSRGRTEYRVNWDNGGSSVVSPLAIVFSLSPEEVAKR